MTIEQRAKALARAAEILEQKAADEASYREAAANHDNYTDHARSRERQHAATEGAALLRREVAQILGDPEPDLLAVARHILALFDDPNSGCRSIFADGKRTPSGMSIGMNEVNALRAAVARAEGRPHA